MKKKIVLLLSVLAALSLGVQGCGSKETAETTAAVAAETTAKEAEKETTVEETTEAETETEAETTAKEADSEVGETGIPAEYEPYLDWTASDWAAASEDERKEAVIAYILYDGIVYQGVDVTAEMMKNAPEVDQIYPVIETGLSSSEFSLKEICDMGHSAVLSLDELDLDADVVEKLQCTADDWAKADDAEKREVAAAMLLVVGKLTGQEITMEMIEGLSDEDMDAQVQNIDAMFESGLYEDATLYELLSM